MKRAVGAVLGFLLAVVCLWLFFRGLEGPDQLRQQVLAANVPLLLALMASSVAHMALRAARWRTLLGEAGRTASFGELFSAVCIGYMALLLPARLGELIRPTLLTRRTHVPLGTTLATVGAERLALDLPMLLVFGALALVLPPSWSGIQASADPQVVGLIRASGMIALLCAVAGLLLVTGLARGGAGIGARIDAWAERRSGRLAARLARFTGQLLPGLAAFGTARRFARLALETLAIWAVIAAGVHCGVAACGVQLAPAATLIILPVTAVGIASGTPGGAGTYQLSMKLVLVGLFGAGQAPAVSAGLIVHAVSLVPLLILGGWFAARGGLGHASAPASARMEASP